VKRGTKRGTDLFELVENVDLKFKS